MLLFKSTALLGCLLSCAAFAGDFPTPYDTEKSTNARLPGLEAAAQTKLPPGFKITLFAGEPDVQQPIGMALDSRGRLWVAENYTYAERPGRWEDKLRDRIVMFEDKDNDGRFDQRTVFYDNLQQLTSILPGFGGVYVLALPQLLFIPDRNGDGVPDGPPEVVLDGFEYKISGHTVANGLKWGPDGWLYGLHGIQGTSLLGPPGTPNSERVAMNVGVWRYHPTRHVVEVVTQGTTNPWGMDWNEVGEAFHINTVIGHLWHAIPGIHVRRMYGEDRNPHIYHVIEQHADHVHWDTRETWSDVRKLGVTEASSLAGGGHAHTGLMIYGGDNWPEEYRGKLYTINYHGRRINSDTLVREGSGYVGKHGKDFAQSADLWFRGLDLIYGPDGGVYLSDWSDTGECHDNDGIHRTSGRIFKITYGTPKKPTIADVAKLSEPELVKLLSHKNEWYARQARLALQEHAAQKASTSKHQELFALLEKGNTVEKLRAMWSLHAVQALDNSRLRSLLGSADEYVRTWAIRFLLDDPTKADAETFRALAALAKKESAASVRLALASALQRLPLKERSAVAAPLLARAEDANDHNLPLMLWYGLEPLGDAHADTLAQLAVDCALPETRLCMARRLAEDIEKNSGPLAAVLAVSLNRPASFQADVLSGATEAFAGWRKAPAPQGWEEMKLAYARSPDSRVRDMARNLSVLFGDGMALDSIRAIALDDKRDAATRRSALKSLIDARAEGLRALCEKLFDVRDLASAAAGGLSLTDDPAVGAFMVNRFARVQPLERPAILSVLVSRASWSRQLLDAVAKDKIPRSELTPFHLRAIRAFKDDALNARLHEVWGEFRETDADKATAIAKWKERLAPPVLARADRQKGYEVFKATCATCHKLYGEGAAIGPDLTGSGRDNLDYLLQNVVDPSAVVPAEYLLSSVTMKDDRTLNGIIRSRTAKTISLQTLTEIVALETAEVKSVETSKLSLMPEGLLEALNETQVRDLIAFLMSKEPPSARNAGSGN